MATTEMIVAVTLIIVAVFYIVERLVHLAAMLYRWYIGGETEKDDVERSASYTPEFGGEETQDLNRWWKVRCNICTLRRDVRAGCKCVSAKRD